MAAWSFMQAAPAVADTVVMVAAPSTGFKFWV